MLKGILYALIACFIWGQVFIVPGLIPAFSSIEIALGRYIVYGLLSLVIFLRLRLRGESRYTKEVWAKSLIYSLVITVGYYTCLVLAVRYLNPAICALILGTTPIIIAFYGNWKQKEISYRSLILPSTLIVIGLAIINVPHLQKSASPLSFLLGLFFALLALIGWCWYVVANARLLKSHPHIDAAHWNNIMGVSSLFWVVVFATIFYSQIQLDAYFTWNEDLKRYILGCSSLGVLCSWVATNLWNKASLELPVSLAGQLTIFETIFGALFFYTLQREWPPLMELLGIGLFLFAVLFGIRQSSKHKKLLVH